MIDAQELSLKGDRATWSGFVDHSEVAPSEGMFTTMKGCVIGKDGTEIERFPGTVKAGTPFYGEMFRPTGWTDHSATDTTIEILNTWKGIAGRDRGHGLQAFAPNLTTRVWLNVVYASSAGFTRLQQEFTATVTGKTTVRIAGLDSSAWTALQPESEIYIDRRLSLDVHSMKWVDRYCCIVAESTWYQGDAQKPGIGRRRSLSTWVSKGNLDWEDNDFFIVGTSIDQKPTWDYWPNPINGGDGLDAREFGFPPGYPPNPKWPILFDYPPRRKAHIHVAADDLIIAVPGYGVVLTANIRGKSQDLEVISKYTRLLGVPKGGHGNYLWEENKLAPPYPFNDDDTFFLSMGYRNRFTGEVGLAGEPKLYSASDLNKVANFLTLFIDGPRHLSPHTAGMSIIIYASFTISGTTGKTKKITAGQELIGYVPIYEIIDGTDKVSISTLIDKAWFFAEEVQSAWETKGGWVQFPSYPRIEQFPMGCSVAETIRGITFYAGAFAYTLDPGVERIQGVNARDRETMWIFMEPDDRAVLGQMDAGRRLPSSWQGAVARVPTTKEPFPGPDKTRSNKVILNLQSTLVREQKGANSPDARPEYMSIEDGAFSEELRDTEELTIDVQMPRGEFWFGEVGAPGRVPSINRGIIDLVKGEDVRAIGRLGDSAVFCTEEETYRLSWGESPLGSNPVILSDSYGCISPRSMVSMPFGLAWLSKDGPVLSTGGQPMWIGAPISTFWKGLKRDSFGLMWQACAVFDPEERRIIWGVRQNLHGTGQIGGGGGGGGPLDEDPVEPVAVYEADDAFSLLPNDTLIIYNIEAKAFTIEELPLGNEIMDLERMPDADGNWRIFAIEEDGNIYQLDTRMVEHAQDTRTWTSDDVGGGTPIFENSTLTTASINKDEVAFIRDSNGDPKWAGLILADSTAGEVTLVGAATATWAAGDTLEVGGKRMVLETTYKAFVGWNRKTTIVSATLVHTVENLNPNATTAFAYAIVTLIDENDVETILGATWGQRLGNFRERFERGYQEINAVRVRVEIFTNAQVKLKDILLEVTQGG